MLAALNARARQQAPLWLLLAILLQGAAAIWWAATLTQRVDDLTARITRIEQRLDPHPAKGQADDHR